MEQKAIVRNIGNKKKQWKTFKQVRIGKFKTDWSYRTAIKFSNN